MSDAEAKTISGILKTNKLPSEQQEIEACKESVKLRPFSEADRNTQSTGG
jgi:hypothetical protein